MRYCSRCVTPANHPRSLLAAGETVCSGCLGFDKRQQVDWARREQSLREVFDWARAHSSGYDCLIPVSGGKDSFWQVLTCLDYGLKPLAFTWRDPARLPLGQHNLDKLTELGVDRIDFRVNPRVERIFLRKSVERFGVPGIPKHMALYHLPLTMALRYRIPLLVWGENAALEYGDIPEQDTGISVDYDWLSRHGVTQGTTAEDWIDEDLSRRDLLPYFGPGEDELAASEVRAVYLGYYLPWDPVRNYEGAARRGFRAPEAGPGYHTFDDVDSGFISIHHYIKWFKFGYTRLFDNLSIEIRNGRLSRDEAMAIIAARGAETPHDDIEAFCRYLAMSPADFTALLERFRNRELWEQIDGVWKVPGFIVDPWDGWADPDRS